MECRGQEHSEGKESMYCANYVCLYISTEITFIVGQVIAVLILF